MTSKGREYRYYICRRYFDRRAGRTCPARYVRADALEIGLWREVRAKLADPVVVLEELRRERRPETDSTEAELLEQRSASLVDRERRLIKLYGFGEVDGDMVRAEIVAIRQERAVLDERLCALRPSPAQVFGTIDEGLLARACRDVEQCAR